MLRKKIVIDFDSERISVMSDGVLLRSCPAAVIRKATESPVVICYGTDAVKKKSETSAGEIFSMPFKCGRIVDEIGARALLHGILYDLFGKYRIVTAYVLVSGGLPESEKEIIEHTVASTGIGRVYIIPRPRVIAKLLEFNKLYAALYMDSDISEFVMASDGQIRSAHTIDVSTTALAEQIRDKLLNTSKLSLSVESSMEIAKNLCSLFNADTTKITAQGKDAITLNPKSIYFTAHDIYPVTERIYSLVCDLMKAVILDEDKDFSLLAAQSGILFIGSGTRISGFEEFVYHQIGLTGISSDDNSILLSLTAKLVEDDEEWA